MARTLVVTSVLTLVAAACSPAPNRLSSGTPAQTSPAPPPAAPAPGMCPLTDLAPPSGVPVTRPILAVKIDDSIPAADPQAGLESADIVYEEPIEGSLDWFMALYQCGNPSRVGPIREAEYEDPGILSQYGSALFAYAPDVSAVVTQKINTTPRIAKVDSVSDGPAYSRDPTRKAPFNLFADPAALRSVHTVTATALQAPEPQFLFVAPSAHAPTPRPSPSVSSVSFQLGPQVGYVYDPQTNAYLRYENGRAHLGASGTQLSVTNVVIMWTQINPSPVVDGAGNASPDPVVVGQGNAMVMTGGVEIDGQWSRAAASDPVTFTDKQGKPIGMNPGNTWIHILPSDETAYVK